MRIVLARAGMWVAMSGYNQDGGTRGRANRNCTLVRREIRIYERCWSRGRTIFWDRLEPTAGYWGLALALGPCINLDVDPPHEQAAYEAVQKALSLAPGATEAERAYIKALAKRYSSDSKVDLRKLDAEYANAMRELFRHYPDDLDAATLYAESLMDLHPWKLWSLDGRPTEGTEQIVSVLESVLRRDPNHIGANHYYIHATEASPHPEWALASARRLKPLAPAAGHLVHMPAHTYFRVGDYAASAL